MKIDIGYFSVILFFFLKASFLSHSQSTDQKSDTPDGKLYFNFGNEGREIMDKVGKPVVTKTGHAVNATGIPEKG